MRGADSAQAGPSSQLALVSPAVRGLTHLPRSPSVTPGMFLALISRIPSSHTQISVKWQRHRQAQSEKGDEDTHPCCPWLELWILAGEQLETWNQGVQM